MIAGVFVLGTAGTVVVTWRFGAVVDGAGGTDVVVTGIVVAGTSDTRTVVIDLTPDEECEAHETRPTNANEASNDFLMFISKV